MAQLLTITLPIFAVILAGYVSAWRGLIDPPGIRGLTAFVFYFALPLMLFQVFANAPVAEEFDGRYVLAYSAVGLTVHLTGLFTARWFFKCTLSQQSIQGIAVSFGNVVFIGMPVAVGLFGDAANLPLLLAITIENGIFMPLTIALLEIDRAGEGGFARAAGAALKAILRNPIVMPVFFGAGFALLGLQLPLALDGIITLVRGAAVPCALFALGATLAGLPLTERLLETSFMVTMKLLVYPVLVFFVMYVFFPDIDPMWRAVGTISAAMPMGANVYLVAARYDAYVQRASTAVFASTVVSIFTISALIVVFG